MNAFDLIVLLVGLLVAGFVALALWTRRGERTPDRPGVRSTCTFRGGWALTTARERARESKVGGEALGDGVSAALSERLTARGVDVLARDRDEHGWGISVQKDGVRAEIVVGVTMNDHHDEWILLVSDAGSSGPAPEELLPLIDGALHEIPGLSEIRWHAREKLHEGAPLSGSDAPIDAKP